MVENVGSGARLPRITCLLCKLLGKLPNSWDSVSSSLQKEYNNRSYLIGLFQRLNESGRLKGIGPDTVLGAMAQQVNCLPLLQLLVINNFRYSRTKHPPLFFPSCFYFYILTKGTMLCSLAFSIFVDIIIAYTLLTLGQEDPLEEGMATHSSILTWKIPWTEEPGGLQSIGSQRARHG